MWQCSCKAQAPKEASKRPALPVWPERDPVQPLQQCLCLAAALNCDFCLRSTNLHWLSKPHIQHSRPKHTVRTCQSMPSWCKYGIWCFQKERLNRMLASPSLFRHRSMTKGEASCHGIWVSSFGRKKALQTPSASKKALKGYRKAKVHLLVIACCHSPFNRLEGPFCCLPIAGFACDCPVWAASCAPKRLDKSVVSACMAVIQKM